MQWQGQRESDNVDDETSSGSGRGGGGRKTLLGGGLGVIVVLLISLITGRNPAQLMSLLQQNNTATTGAHVCHNTDSENELSKKFSKVILASTEDVWTPIFQQMGATYTVPRLDFFCDAVTTGCGQASASSGPFYCPADQKAYIDLSFYTELKNRFNAPGDFAMAYVIAHEIGHHVQNLLGISAKIERMRQNMSEVDANKLSVKLELQADFLAGVWAYHAQKMKNWTQTSDIEAALNAAHAIGDDNLQKQAQGYIVPDAFTHGTSAQRMYWFKKGFETGDIKQGDTFGSDM
jgi:predicted metalloprotease